MNILYQWAFRTHRDNPLHTLFTVLDLAFSYTLLFCTAFVVGRSIRNHGTDGSGIMWYLSFCLTIVLIISSFLTMYNAFSVTIQERKRRYMLWSTCGTTIEQIRRGLFAEAFILDCAGLAAGIGLGSLICLIVNSEFMDRVQIAVDYQKIEPVGLYYWIPLEFLFVLVAMALACRRNLVRLHEPPVSIKANPYYPGREKSLFFGRPSSKTTMDPTLSTPLMLEIS